MVQDFGDILKRKKEEERNARPLQRDEAVSGNLASQFPKSQSKRVVFNLNTETKLVATDVTLDEVSSQPVRTNLPVDKSPKI